MELGAARSMAIHFGTFQLSQEGREAPGDGLAAARAEAGLARSEFVVPAVGESVAPPPSDPPTAPVAASSG